MLVQISFSKRVVVDMMYDVQLTAYYYDAHLFEPSNAECDVLFVDGLYKLWKKQWICRWMQTL